MRRCSRTGCQSPARATLTYNYADSQVVVGPLAQLAEPHIYDLCLDHARRVTAPRGWEVLRLELPAAPEDAPAAPRTTTPAGGAPRTAPGTPPPSPGLRVVRGGE